MLLRVLLLALVVVTATGAAPTSREPANLDVLKQEIAVYVDSGKYQEDIATVAAEATAWLRERVARGGKRLTVVFDLDETLLSNWSHMKEMGFVYVPDAWRAWVQAARAPAIEPVREVYREARKLGLDVIFLTGRPERERAATRKNLEAIGCGDYVADVQTRRFPRYGGRIQVGDSRTARSGRARDHCEHWGPVERRPADTRRRSLELPNPFYLTK